MECIQRSVHAGSAKGFEVKINEDGSLVRTEEFTVYQYQDFCSFDCKYDPQTLPIILQVVGDEYVHGSYWKMSGLNVSVENGIAHVSFKRVTMLPSYR